MSRNEMDNTDRLFDEIDSICTGQPAADVVYALAMMYAKALKDQSSGDIREAAKSFGSAVALEMKYPRSRVNLTALAPASSNPVENIGPGA